MGIKNDVMAYPLLPFYTLIFFFYLYFPIIVIVGFSFSGSPIVGTWTEFSLHWYESALNNATLLDAVKTSFLVAIIVTVISSTLALAAALVIVRERGVKFREVSQIIVNLPLLVPEIVLAVAMLILFAQLGIKDGMLKLIIAHLTFCIPFAFLPIRARLQGMDLDLDEAAQDLYANKWTVFRRVTLPLVFPGVLSGGTLAFIISMDDFITSNMLNSGGTTTLPVYIFSLVRQGVTPELNAIATLIILFSMALAAFALLLEKK